MSFFSNNTTVRLAPLITAVALSMLGCGGGSVTVQVPVPPAPPPPVDSSPDQAFNLVQAAPQTHEGKLAATTSSNVTVEFRRPDGISATDYCVLRYQNLVHSASGKTYGVNVAFDARSHRVFHLVAYEGTAANSTWSISASNPPAGTAWLDERNRVFHIYAKLNGLVEADGWSAFLLGSASYPTTAEAAACFAAPL